MKSIIKIAGSVLLITLFTGCASVICGPKQVVAIDSRPNGAEVLIYDSRGEIIQQKTTPCKVELSRRAYENFDHAHYVVLIRKEGYAPVQVPIEGIVNRAYFANILCGGIGLIVDPMTGSMWTLTPEKVNPKLASENSAFLNNKDGITVCLKEQVPQALVPYLEPVTN